MTKKSKRTKAKPHKKPETETSEVEQVVNQVSNVIPAPELTKEQKRIQELEKQVAQLKKAQPRRAYSITAGEDATVPTAEVRAVTQLFPEWSITPTQRELGETIRPRYLAALRRLKKLAGL